MNDEILGRRWRLMVLRALEAQIGRPIPRFLLLYPNDANFI